MNAISIKMFGVLKYIDSELPCFLESSNRKDQYANTLALSDTLKSSCEVVSFCCGN